MSENDTDDGEVDQTLTVEDAISTEEKLQPDQVPECDYIAHVKGPMTDQKTLLVFNDQHGNPVGVRLSAEELDRMLNEMNGWREVSAE